MATLKKPATFGNSLREEMEKEVNSSETTNKVKAKYYINVGIKLQLQNGEFLFVKLPLGIGVDTINKHNVPEKNSDYARKLSRENKLLADALSIFDSMQPGEHFFPEDIAVEFYRVEEPEPEEIEDDLYDQISFSR